jgi:uncharacterized protein (UPF0332 family)
MKNILEKLLEQGLLQKEKGIGIDQVQKRLARAEIDLRNAKIILPRDDVGAYRMAYDAMLQAGIALVLYYGYRPKVLGFHKTIVESVSLILGKKYGLASKKFDQMRKNRHQAIYDIGIISRTEANNAVDTADKFIKEIVEFIKKEKTQKELL